MGTNTPVSLTPPHPPPSDFLPGPPVGQEKPETRGKKALRHRGQMRWAGDRSEEGDAEAEEEGHIWHSVIRMKNG